MDHPHFSSSTGLGALGLLGWRRKRMAQGYRDAFSSFHFFMLSAMVFIAAIDARLKST